ncbi:putative P-loop containing nucleoside triphosphate hydrolase [Helianthus annuus]|nr:putative P-loop containing nucleoside triphosphate hydrolase [Helianthus annuus]
MQQMLTSSNSYPPVLHLNRALGRQVLPKTLEKVLVHQVIAQNFKKLVTVQDCPHLLFYVPPGSGKKTLIMALLWQMFGASADKVKVENKNWKVDFNMVLLYAGSRTIDLELTTLSSTHHVELNPSDVGFQDRSIVQEIIKEMAKKKKPIDTKGKKGFKEAQSLRRTMEKYSASCCLIKVDKVLLMVAGL